MKPIVFFLFFLMALHSAASALTVDQHFSPQPRIDVPAQLAGASAEDLKRYEIELARRLEKTPDDLYLAHRLGTVLFHQGRRDEAQRVWKRASSLEPNLASADLMTDIEDLFALLARNDTAAAQQKLTETEKRHGSSAHFLLVQGEQALRGGNREAAEKAYRKAAEVGPRLYVTHLNLARFLEGKNDLEGAYKAYVKATELAPKRAESWGQLGRYQFRQGDSNAALTSFGQAQKVDPNEAMAEIQMAVLCFEHRDTIGARYWYKAALAQKPENENAVRVALSDVLMRLGLMDEARQEVETVLQANEMVPLLVVLATIDEAQNKPEQAQKRYRRALALQPDDVIAANNLAMLLVRLNQSPEEALQLAEKARAAMPENANILGTHACALYHAGKQEQARQALVRAVRLNPGDPWIHYFLGMLMHKNKPSSEARMHLEGALILDPRFPGQEQIRKLLGTGPNR